MGSKHIKSDSAGKRHSIIKLFLVFAIITIIVFIMLNLMFTLPKVNKSFVELQNNITKNTLKITREKLSSYIGDRLVVLRKIAGQSIIVNTVMLDKPKSPIFVDHMDHQTIIGKKASLAIINIDNEFVYKNNSILAEYITKNTKKLAGFYERDIPYMIHLINNHKQSFFILSVPIRYGAHTEGVLSARIAADPNLIFGKINDLYSVINITSNRLNNNHSDENKNIINLEKYNLTIHYQVNNSLIQKQRSIVLMSLIKNIIIGTLISAIITMLLGYYIIAQPYNALAESEKAVSSALEGISTIDTDGNFIELNSAYALIFGYQINELLGKQLSTMIYPDDQHIFKELYSSINQESISRNEIRGITKDNSIIYIILTLLPVYNKNNIIKYYCFVQDVTERKTAEIALLKTNKELNFANKQLDDFVYIASHDLKEPLRAIFNHSEFLLEDYSDKLDTDGVKRLNRLTYLSKRMEKLINDLLYFSRLGREKVQYKMVDINDIIVDINNTLQDLLLTSNTTINVSESLPSVLCEKITVTELFRNLITNAIKYNDSEIKLIEIGCNISDKDEKVFYVKDNGIGIEKGFHENVFRIFKRLNSDKKYGEGTGSGLTFAKKIVEQHNGDIWIESDKGKGATFHFTLAAAQD